MDEPRKVALITGAARGIGAAAAMLFARNKFTVVATDILPDDEKLAEAIWREGGECLYLRFDVSNESEVIQAVKQTVDRFGTIDALINNAGIVLVTPLENTSWEQFQKVVNINLGGTVLMCKYALPIMKQRRTGAIVNVASVSGHVGQKDHAVYGSTKGALIAFTRALAWEVAEYGIRVNSISPGSVDTPMLRGDIQIESKKTGLPVEEVKALREAEQAFNRWADPMEIAETIYFMASSKASFITGSDLLVDCGWVAK